MKLINATTAIADRTFNDVDPRYDQHHRKLDIELNGGEVAFKTTLDGINFATKKTFSGSNPEPQTFNSRDLHWQIECTGNAVCKVTGGF